MLGTLVNIEKFDNISEFSENILKKPIVELVGNQSIKITLHCGCSLVEHSVSREKHIPNKDINNEVAIKRFKNINSVRKYWVEFCKKH